MNKAAAKDKERVIDILTKSFDTNKNVNYVVKQDKKRTDRIKSLMDYTFDYNLKTGEVYLSTNGSMVLNFPERSPGIISSLTLTLRLISKSIGVGRLMKVLNWKSKVNKFLPKTPFIYLDFIGVLPDSQRMGEGSSLLKKAIERSKELSLPIYLITSMPENIPFYNRHEFEVYKETIVGHKIYFLRRFNNV